MNPTPLKEPLFENIKFVTTLSLWCRQLAALINFLEFTINTLRGTCSGITCTISPTYPTKSHAIIHKNCNTGKGLLILVKDVEEFSSLCPGTEK